MYFQSKLIEWIIFKYRKIIEYWSYSSFGHRFILRLWNHIYSHLKQIIMLFIFEVCVSYFFSIFLCRMRKNVFVKLKCNLLFEFPVIKFWFHKKQEIFVFYRSKLYKKAYLVVDNVKIFKCSKEIGNKIPIIIFIHFEGITSCIGQSNFSDNCFVPIIFSNILIVCNNLKIIEVRIKLWLKRCIRRFYGIQRIIYLSFLIMNSQCKCPFWQCFWYIIEKTLKTLFSFFKWMIYFYKMWHDERWNGKMPKRLNDYQ